MLLYWFDASVSVHKWMNKVWVAYEEKNETKKHILKKSDPK